MRSTAYSANTYRLSGTSHLGHGSSPASSVFNIILVKMMIDPFEVRMRFTTQLQHLSASVTSSQKAAHYALKYRDLDEDLHSCILEQIERVKEPTTLSMRSESNMQNRTT